MAERPKPLEPEDPAGRLKAVSFEDAHLVEQVQAGRVEAYGELVRKYQDRVFNACWRICGNLEDARDLTQDAFIKGLEGIASFRQQSGFYTWIFRVAVNLTLSHRRKRKRRKTVSLDQAVGSGGSQAQELVRRVQDHDARDPQHETSEAELQAATLNALQQLEHDHRAMIVLRDIEGLDYAEIAEVLEVPAGTVKSRLYRARMRLRELVKTVLPDGD